jgi:hypothetical protein
MEKTEPLIALEKHRGSKRNRHKSYWTQKAIIIEAGSFKLLKENKANYKSNNIYVFKNGK